MIYNTTVKANINKLRKIVWRINMIQEYKIPSPIVDSKEIKSLEVLTERYKKIIEPSNISKLGTVVVDGTKKVINNAAEKIPDNVKNIGNTTKGAVTGIIPERMKTARDDLINSIDPKELYVQVMKVVTDGFGTVQEIAAKYSISEKEIVQKIDKFTPNNEITCLDEICLSRSYDISKLVNKIKDRNKGLAFFEGGATGYFGFAGLPFNIVLSFFLYFRAVQEIAMTYGYDVKNDSSEMMIAANVFMSSISPESNDLNEMTSMIGKFLVVTETTAIKQAAKQSWSAVISKGHAGLLITQIRALANKQAQKALETAGQKSLELGVFKNLFTQIGKNMSQKALQKSLPVISSIISALFDIAQMKKVIEYADVFYNKRFILEKEERIKLLIDSVERNEKEIIDIKD